MVDVATNNYSLHPNDGWVLIAPTSVGSFLRIHHTPCHVPIYLAVGATPPPLYGTPGTGTVTFSTGVPTAGQTVTVGTETYTFVTSGSAPFSVVIGGTNLVTATNFAASVNANSALVSASNSSGVVTLTSKITNINGNYALATNATNVVVSGSALTGGANPNSGFRVDSGSVHFDSGFNGNVYARIPTNANERVLVSVWQNNDTPSAGTVTTSALVSSTAPSYTSGSTQALSLDTSGNLRITGTINATTAAQATTAAPSYTNNTSNPLSQDLSGNLRVSIAGLNGVTDTSAANTSGGVSTWSAPGGTGNALLTATAVTAATGAHNVYGWSFFNSNIADTFIQVFDLPSASVTLGTTVPKLVIQVTGGNGTNSSSWEEKFTGEAKISFSNAITFAATTTSTGSTAPVSGVLANLQYK